MASEFVTALSKEADRIEEDALYSSRGHFEAALLWSRVSLWIGLPATLFSAIASASAFKNDTITAGLLAALVAALAATSTFLNPSDRSNAHHQAGTKFSGLKNQARIFRTITLIAPGASEPDLHEQLGLLTKQRDELNETSHKSPGGPSGALESRWRAPRLHTESVKSELPNDYLQATVHAAECQGCPSSLGSMPW